MNLSLLLAQQIVVIAIMIAIGFIAGKTKMISLEGSSHISRLVLYVVAPCMMIDSFQMEFSKDKMIGFGIAVAAAVAAHIMLILIGKLCQRLFHFKEVAHASIIYSNCGNLLIPIISYMLGKEYVFYCCAFIVVQNILLWTHGVSLMTGEKKIQLKKVITNPNILGIIVGMALFFARITLPDFLGSAISRTGDCIGPLSMIIIGIMISNADLKLVFLDHKTWIVTAVRLFVCPAAFILLILITGVSHLTPDAGSILFVSFLAVAAPSASAVSQFSNIVHKDEVLAGSINVMTVVCCMVTMPLMTILYQTLCM